MVSHHQREERMSAGIKRAKSAAGVAFEADIAYWTNPRLKKFSGVELLSIAGGAALTGFTWGFFHILAEKAGEELLESLDEYVRLKIEEAEDRIPAQREKMLEEISQEVSAIIKKQNLNQKELGEIADVVQSALSKAFLGDAPNAPEDVRSEIARAVRDAAMEVLMEN